MSASHGRGTAEDVRPAVYATYGRDFQDTGGRPDVASAERWGRGYRWYFRGWLPADRHAVIGDLACGAGRLLQFFQSLGYERIYGVDIAPDQVAAARQVVPTVDQGDVIEWLAARPGMFDLLVALDLIEHFRRDEALEFLDRCFGALKPGGRLILQTLNADSPFGLQHRYGDVTHEWAYNANQLGRLLRRAGFAEVEVREQGPVPWGYSVRSTVRFVLWRLIRVGLQVWNLAETGAALPVLTRIFLTKGDKPNA
jgi:SAM-dependent methyltransferase